MVTINITPEDVTTRDLTGATANIQAEKIKAKIDDAVALIMDMYGDAVTRRIATKDLSARTYTRIVCDMVLRVLRNAAAGGHVSESDGSYSYSDGALAASADLWIPDKDVALLTGDGAMTVPGVVYTGPQAGWWP